MCTALDFTKKCFILITGASRGIGQSLAIEISRPLIQGSIIGLLARSEGGLKETKSLIEEKNKRVTVLTYIRDLSNPNIDDFNNIFKKIQGTIDKNDIHSAIIFHNAAYMGTMKNTEDLIDINDWRKYFDTNFFSVVLLNSAFLKNMKSFTQQLMCVNITSSLAHNPHKNMVMGGSVKAARNIFFKVLALEDPQVTVLNYTPGFVDTNMYSDAIEGVQSDEVKQLFIKIKETNILTPLQTVNKLLSILQKGDYKSGDICDYSN